MKKNITKIITTILLIPIAVVFLLFLLVLTPIDYYKYKKSRYYKDTKEKYSWLCTVSYYIKLYDLIKKENLPIDYYRCNNDNFTGYGFFVYKDTLILNEFDPCFDAEKNIWLAEIEDEYVDIKGEVEAAINECNDLLKNDICKKAVVLIDKDLFDEHPDVKYENIDFLPVKNDYDIEAIKTILQ
ncbi:MAG: hypothetical protein E7574_03220 [Ruminococcaceae bacterium]|nr:hypothetical protein [Oscillospiraceae bacterium]